MRSSFIVETESIILNLFSQELIVDISVLHWHGYCNFLLSNEFMKKNIFLASAAVAATGLTMYFAKKRSSEHIEFQKQKLNKKQVAHLTPSFVRSNAYLYDLAIYDDRPE